MYSDCLVALISIHLNSPRLGSIACSIKEEVPVAVQRPDTLTLSDVLPNIHDRVVNLIQVSVIETYHYCCNVCVHVVTADAISRCVN